MIKYQFHKSKLLFVGINPHFGSYSRGIPFSNNKMFWYLLSRAKVIDENINDLKDDKKLKKFYLTKFHKKYKLGFVNVINRATRKVSELKKGEEKKGQRRIAKIIKNEKPKIVCFIGKISYQKFSGLKKIKFGWKDNIFSSKVYVMHFPLHGKAIVRIHELKEIFNQFKKSNLS